MTEGSDTERFSTWIANWQVTARKKETGLSPVVWNSNYLFGNFYVGQVTHLTTPRSAPGHECGSRIIDQRSEDFENNLPNIIESYFNRVLSTLQSLVCLKSIMVLRLHYVHLRESHANGRRGKNYGEVTIRELITRGMQDSGRLEGY